MTGFHVVLGAGAAGLATAAELHRRGHEVLVVNRSAVDPRRLPGGVRGTAADITEPGLLARLADGATALHNCTHAPYPQWPEVLPKLQDAVLTGAAATGARVVVVDTLYPYGETGGEPMTEATPNRATSRKGKLRAELTQRYLDSGVPVAIGRAADFFGPGVLVSALGGTVFPAALTGQPVLVLGDTTLPHAYTYIGDVARGLATLGEHADAAGRVWLLPTVPAVSTDEVLRLVGELTGGPLTVERMTEPTPFGPFDQTFMDEYAELFYQYTEPQIVDSSAIQRRYGLAPTPLPDALRTTTDWFRTLG
jgi:nucleoside-diphosphate-sugar epimerase